MVGSSLLAVLVGAAFLVLFAAVSSSRDATKREALATDLTAATLTLERLVLDLETGLRGLALTGNEQFLQPWTSARQELPRALFRFERLAGDSESAQDAETVSRLVRAYVNDYSIPLVGIARESPEVARTRVATAEGKRRSDAIRALLGRVRSAVNRTAEARAESADDRSRLAVVLAGTGLVVSSLGIVLFAAYLARSIARPVRDVAEAAKRFAAGQLSLRLAEQGPGEIGELTRSFNVMAGELDRQRSELEDQNAQLRESEQLKSELISIASHEVRTPLSSVLGFTKLLLKDEADTETRRHYLTIIETQAQRLAALLDDFLTLDRLEKGQLQLRRELVDVATLLQDQVELFTGQSERHRLELRAPEDSLAVHGDSERLAQVVGNLLSNAIKYSPHGGKVEVVAEQVNHTVRVSVRDEGVGIPTEQQDRIFTKFYRGKAGDSGIPGSGLGLAFSRAVAEAHGGRITFASVAGKGSTFSLELPAAGESTSASKGEP